MKTAEERRERLARLRLYVITGDEGDEAQTARIVEAALDGGAEAIQLRKKTMSMGEQYRLALKLRILADAHQALLFVNDHADLAVAAEADGVHLGQDDLPPRVVRNLPGFEGRLIGRSTHNLPQAQAAVADGVDYVAVGPIFATPTKAGRPAVGYGLIREVAPELRRPLVAVGGLDIETAPNAVDAGAQAVAVVRAVYDAADPGEAARRLHEAIVTRRSVAAK